MPIPRTTYAVKQDLPPNPSVIIVFRGLFNFSFGGNLNCEAGVNNHTHGVPGPDRHELDVKVWVKTGAICQQLPISIPNPPATGIDVTTINPAQLDGVYVFQRNPKVAFNRTAAGNHDNDFRWSLDMEGPEFYDRRLEKRPLKLRPSINIDNGIFYTRQKTQSLFRLELNSAPRPLGSVAKLIAANIYLQAGGSVQLRLGQDTHTFQQAPNVTHQIDFTNDCTPVVGHCDFDPGSSIKERRNDFHLNFQTFNRPTGTQEFLLRIDQRNPAVRDNGLCGTISDEGGITEGEETTDPAPCMGCVFGQTPSFD